MKKFRRISCVLLAFALIFTCVKLATNPGAAAADFTFDVKTGYITGYNGTDKYVVIPPEIAGYTIKGIKEGCFKNKDITGVEIPDTVTEIEKEVFRGCEHLKEINMSGNILKIGDSAFEGCTAFKKVEIPYSAQTVGKYAFKGCTSLKQVIIPYSVTEIGESVFENCSSLVSIVYQAKAAEIPKAFCKGCVSLQYFDIPDNITQISQSAFEGCKSLLFVNFPEGLDIIEAYAYKDCTGLKTLFIPENVSSVGYQAFMNCSDLKTAILDNDHFGKISGACTDTSCETFANCINLTDVKILNNMTNLGENNTFKGCTSLVNVTIPANVVTISESTFADCSPNLTIYCKQNTEALKMALAAGHNYSFDPAPAFDNSDVAPVAYKAIDVCVDEQYLYFDQEPVLENNRTLVPLRAIFEALGATVDWDGTTQTVTAKKGNVTITLQINSNTMYKNNKAIGLDVPATLRNSRTLVPVRAVSEAFDCDVDWNGKYQTVIIKK